MIFYLVLTVFIVVISYSLIYCIYFFQKKDIMLSYNHVNLFEISYLLYYIIDVSRTRTNKNKKNEFLISLINAYDKIKV